MLRRHPHIFGEVDFADERQVRINWEREKLAERECKGAAGTGSLLGGVAHALPALVRAEKLQRRAARVGFDWDDIEGVLGKVREELSECEQTAAAHLDATERVHELGDLLFSCVNLARHLGIDAEQALRTANHRFERRFAVVETNLREQGREPGPDVRDEMERLWEGAKAKEKGGCRVDRRANPIHPIPTGRELMKELTWDRTLSVDVPEIDEDHRRLVDLLNILNRSVVEGDSTAYIEAVLEELISCTVWHFRHEERLMLKYAYPGALEHKSEHQELIECAKALRRRLLREGKGVSSEDVEFLEHWLAGHILGADMDLGSYLCEVM
jgi:hemerythrin-like metal-binding protein